MKVLVATSGGPDSMYLLQQTLNDKKYEPVVVHINYHLRQSSNRDQKIVEVYCEENNIELFLLDVKKDNWRNSPVKNKEASARFIRYEFFKQVSKETGINTLLIAHHLDDWIETAIMMEDKSNDYLYYGIKPETEYKDLKIFRPLIEEGFFKTDILKKMHVLNIPFGLDETNENLKYTRNKIRANLLLATKKSKKNIIEHYKKINKSKYKLYIKISNLYIDWKQTKFDWSFYNEISDKYKADLIYYFLTKQSEFININRNKLSALLDFLKSSAEKRNYRLMEGIDFSIIDSKIRILNEKSNNR